MNFHTDSLRTIRFNIMNHGYHLYIVSGGVTPRYAYTVGLAESGVGAEIILAGAVGYLARDVEAIVQKVADLERGGVAPGKLIDLGNLGGFRLQEVSRAWIEALALGALEYYNQRPFKMFQLLPDSHHTTVDVPDMSRKLNESEGTAWQWLWMPWNHSVPSSATATTNLDALRGAPITEAARWENDEWELFAGSGPDVDSADIRVVPIGTLLAHAPTLEAVLGLAVGKATWRDEEMNWHQWGEGE